MAKKGIIPNTSPMIANKIDLYNCVFSLPAYLNNSEIALLFLFSKNKASLQIMHLVSVC